MTTKVKNISGSISKHQSDMDPREMDPDTEIPKNEEQSEMSTREWVDQTEKEKSRNKTKKKTSIGDNCKYTREELIKLFSPYLHPPKGFTFFDKITTRTPLSPISLMSPGEVEDQDREFRRGRGRGRGRGFKKYEYSWGKEDTHRGRGIREPVVNKRPTDKPWKRREVETTTEIEEKEVSLTYASDWLTPAPDSNLDDLLNTPLEGNLSKKSKEMSWRRQGNTSDQDSAYLPPHKKTEMKLNSEENNNSLSSKPDKREKVISKEHAHALPREPALSTTKTESSIPPIKQTNQSSTQLPPSPASRTFFYKDPHGKEQGPFSSPQMDKWLRANYFSTELEVRVSDTKEFIQLGNLFFREQANPFTGQPLMIFFQGPHTKFKTKLWQVIQNLQRQEQLQHMRMLGQTTADGKSSGPIFGPVSTRNEKEALHGPVLGPAVTGSHTNGASKTPISGGPIFGPVRGSGDSQLPPLRTAGVGMTSNTSYNWNTAWTQKQHYIQWMQQQQLAQNPKEHVPLKQLTGVYQLDESTGAPMQTENAQSKLSQLEQHRQKLQQQALHQSSEVQKTAWGSSSTPSVPSIVEIQKEEANMKGTRIVHHTVEEQLKSSTDMNSDQTKLFSVAFGDGNTDSERFEYAFRWDSRPEEYKKNENVPKEQNLMQQGTAWSVTSNHQTLSESLLEIQMDQARKSEQTKHHPLPTTTTGPWKLPSHSKGPRDTQRPLSLLEIQREELMNQDSEKRTSSQQGSQASSSWVQTVKGPNAVIHGTQQRLPPGKKATLQNRKTHNTADNSGFWNLREDSSTTETQKTNYSDDSFPSLVSTEPSRGRTKNSSIRKKGANRTKQILGQ
jgi:hypothetical protein